MEVAAPPSAHDERYFHEDLPQLSVRDLLREYRRLELAAELFDRLPDWSRERLRRIQRELVNRHAAD
jgi:hypothetical protein